MRLGADLANLVVGTYHHAAGHVLDNLRSFHADLRYLAQLVAVHVEKANCVRATHAHLVAHQINIDRENGVD